MFDEYIGKHLTQRHKYEGLKYARKHGYPELIGTNSYGILFKQKGDDYLVFRVHFDSMPLYDRRGGLIPGRTIKTITEVDLFGNGYTQEEMARAEQIARGYLERVVEEQMNKTGDNKMTNTELTAIRETLNLTKGELAKKLDILPMILGRYEKGSLAIPEAVAEKVRGMAEPKPKRRTVRRKKTPEETTVSTPEEVAEAVKAEMARLVDEFNKTSDEKFEVESVQVEVVGDSEPVEKQDIVDAVEKAFKEQLIPVAEEQKPVEKKATADEPKKPAKSRKKKAATPTLIILK